MDEGTTIIEGDPQEEGEEVVATHHSRPTDTIVSLTLRVRMLVSIKTILRKSSSRR